MGLSAVATFLCGVYVGRELAELDSRCDIVEQEITTINNRLDFHDARMTTTETEVIKLGIGP